MHVNDHYCCKFNFTRWEVYFKVPDTVHENWMIPFLYAHKYYEFLDDLPLSKQHEYHVFRQYRHRSHVPVFTNTGTFQYPQLKLDKESPFSFPKG